MKRKKFNTEANKKLELLCNDHNIDFITKKTEDHKKRKLLEKDNNIVLIDTDDTNLTVVKKLIENGGGYIGHQSFNNNYLVISALQNKHFGIAKELIQNTEGIEISQLLNRACENKELSEIKFLIATKADPSISTNNGWKSLHYIACHEDYKLYTLEKISTKTKKIINILLKNGAQLTDKDNDGNNIIHLSVHYNNLGMLKFLHKNYNNDFNQVIDSINDNNITPLIISTIKNKLEITKFLLEQKADPFVKSLTGDSPYSIGVSSKKNEVKKLYDSFNVLYDESIKNEVEEISPIELIGEDN